MFRKLTRFLKWLDPDLLGEEVDDDDLAPAGTGQFSIFHSFWPIRRSASNVNLETSLGSLDYSLMPKNGEILEAKALVKLFLQLDTESVKQCRLVCRHWKTHINEILKGNSAVVIHGEDTGSFLRDGAVEKCVKYLKLSVTKFSLWKTLRFQNMKEPQIKTLLECRDFQIAVKSILELQLITCEISWKSLLKIMKQFINLQIFMDKKSVYTNLESSSVIRSLTLWNSSRKPQGTIESNFVKKDICLEDLKSLKIFKVDTGQNTTDLIKILTVTTVDLEEFHLKLDPQNKHVTIKDTFEFERHLNILFILNARSLKKLYIDMMDTNQIEYFNDFLKLLQGWISSSTSQHAFELEELVLKFKYIWLSRNFASILIPFVAKLSKLQICGIGLISFNKNSAHFLSQLKDVLPPGCSFEFGIFVSDHVSHEQNVTAESGTVESISLKSSDILKSDVYYEHMTDLLVGVFHDEVTGICDLIPPAANSPTYEKTVDLSIFTDGVYRPNFQSFNVQLLCYHFVNVTNLEIVDGPYDSYFKSMLTFKKSSEALIGDKDLQSIMQCMQMLQKLMIFANMERLTDSGITGLLPEICRGMVAIGEFRLQPEDVQGYQFQHLKYLQYISLRGVGTGLSDVSAFWGFSNIKSLKTLIVSQFAKISPKGRNYLETMYPRSKGCFVAII